MAVHLLYADLLFIVITDWNVVRAINVSFIAAECRKDTCLCRSNSGSKRIKDWIGSLDLIPAIDGKKKMKYKKRKK